ncbi:MAG TPA: hypothetical protein VMR96_10970, partial [Solirubrobacterales bacterium]|nr:hypothetical protein [Solirubrobacterales bacterium]
MKADGWQRFYVDVMGGDKGEGLFPSKYNGVTGSIFERIVRLSTGKALRKEKPLFVNPPGTKHLDQRVDGDDAAVEGQVFIDSKASAAGIEKPQCLRYNKIIEFQIPGYFASESEEQKAAPRHYYKAVAYTVAGKEIAKLVKHQIEDLFPDNKTLWDRFHVSPSPDDLKEFLLQFNPTVRLQTKDKGKSSYTFHDPPSLVSGVRIKKATIQAEPAGTKIHGGSVDMAIDMAGAIKNDNIKSKPITPNTGVGLGGTVENKFGGFKSTLDKVLGAVTVDAKLIEGGVEATIALKPGAAKIPQFEVNAAVLTARYVNDALTIDGEVELTHKSKKVSGTVKVAWEGNSWSFDGQATLADGLVPGLSKATLGVSYAKGKTKIYCPFAEYQRKIGAIDLKGTVRNLEYDVNAGGFSGEGDLEADLGMFGTASASATFEHNQLKSASFSYDSPEFKYPAKSDNPGFRGTVGGTIHYANGKFSGAIRGAANINIPALKAVGGDSGVGLAVDAHLNADGSYSGTVRSTSALKFGKHIEVPLVSCTLDKDGGLSGSFEIKIVNIKYLTEASIKCSVTDKGIEIEDAKVEVPFGNEGKGKFWGTLAAGYSKGRGLEIGGAINYKIKDGMIATGTLKYSTETHEVSLEMTVSEITLLDKTVSKTLFRGGKQIPIVNIVGLGVYVDIGFELGFNFGFKLGLKPTVKFEGLSLETWQFTEIAAKMELLGNIYAELVGTPKLGIGVFALDPSILRGGGGLKVPIVGRAELKPTGTLGLSYSPSGEVKGESKIGMAMTFGITGSVKPYAEFSVLNDLWNPKWEGEALTSFEILKPKELFNFTVDLGSEKAPDETPPLPEENAAKDPTPAAGNKVLEQTEAAPTERGEGVNKSAKTETAPKEGGEEGPFSLSSL